MLDIKTSYLEESKNTKTSIGLLQSKETKNPKILISTPRNSKSSFSKLKKRKNYTFYKL